MKSALSTSCLSGKFFNGRVKAEKFLGQAVNEGQQIAGQVFGLGSTHREVKELAVDRFVARQSASVTELFQPGRQAETFRFVYQPVAGAACLGNQALQTNAKHGARGSWGGKSNRLSLNIGPFHALWHVFRGGANYPRRVDDFAIGLDDKSVASGATQEADFFGRKELATVLFAEEVRSASSIGGPEVYHPGFVGKTFQHRVNGKRSERTAVRANNFLG